jgi:hydroxymethylglutaryl-CoA synthase
MVNIQRLVTLMKPINALANMSQKRNLDIAQHLRKYQALFMHRPFHRMPINAFTIIYLYALSIGNSDDLDELSGYANIADVNHA